MLQPRLATTKKMPILKQRGRLFEGDTGLSLLLPATCPSDECGQDTCSVESPPAGQRNVFLLARKEDSEWEVKCVLFDDVELPTLYTELPEARNLEGDDRTRGLSAEQPQQQKKSSSSPVKKTISIQGFGSDPEPAGLGVSPFLRRRWILPPGNWSPALLDLEVVLDLAFPPFPR